MTDISIGSIPYFDCHSDTISECTHKGWSLRRAPGHLDLERLSQFRKAAQVFAIYADGKKYEPGTLFAEACRQHEVFESEMAKNTDLVTFCPAGAGIAAANDAGKIAAVLSIEGGEMLASDPEKLQTAHDWGVRLVNITWNHVNGLSGTNIDQPDKGLTDKGRAFVREAQRLGILLDVSHLSDPGFWDLAQMTDGPLVASHSNARVLCGHPRNVTDDMFRAIRDSGGIVGFNMYIDFIGGESMDQAIRHFDHFMELDGGKTLALGGDWDGCDLACGFAGIQDLPQLWNALAAHGYDQATLEDIFFNNVLRVLG